MKLRKIEADSLEEALTLASKLFNCSVVELEYEIIQYPKSGFLGLGKKSAIICAQHLQTSQLQESSPTPTVSEEKIPTLNNANPTIHSIKAPIHNPPSPTKAHTTKPETKPTPQTPIDPQKQELYNIAKKVQEDIIEMFKCLPFCIDTIIVKPLEDNSLYIELQGEDCALLIGKEGYRYKAISYLLFNWINTQYGLPIRLEIAEFLRNQEYMIEHYLQSVIENVKSVGYAQTKPLNGVLAHIALRQLRATFPDKYVSFRQTNDGERFVIINEFR